MQNNQNKSKCAGYTLLEVVIAFAILSASIGTIYQSFYTGPRTATTTDMTERALLFAHAKIDRLGNDQSLEIGESDGEFADKRFRWSLSLQEMPDTSYQRRRGANVDRVTPITVALKVSWREGRHSRDLSLNTIKLLVND